MKCLIKSTNFVIIAQEIRPCGAIVFPFFNLWFSDPLLNYSTPAPILWNLAWKSSTVHAKFHSSVQHVAPTGPKQNKNSTSDWTKYRRLPTCYAANPAGETFFSEVHLLTTAFLNDNVMRTGVTFYCLLFSVCYLLRISLIYGRPM